MLGCVFKCEKFGSHFLCQSQLLGPNVPNDIQCSLGHITYYHIKAIVNKAISYKMLNFVKRMLYHCDPEVKATAYSTLVRPSLEYATMVWYPHQQYLINSIEMVQRRAARWVKQEYSMTTSVTAILNNLEWNLLSKRRQFSRLTLFFKFLHQDPPVIRISQHYPPSTFTH